MDTKTGGPQVGKPELKVNEQEGAKQHGEGGKPEQLQNTNPKHDAGDTQRKADVDAGRQPSGHKLAEDPADGKEHDTDKHPHSEHQPYQKG